MSITIHDNNDKRKQARLRKDATKNLLELFKRVSKMETELSVAKARITELEENGL